MAESNAIRKYRRELNEKLFDYQDCIVPTVSPSINLVQQLQHAAAAEQAMNVVDDLLVSENERIYQERTKHKIEVAHRERLTKLIVEFNATFSEYRRSRPDAVLDTSDGILKVRINL